MFIALPEMVESVNLALRRIQGRTPRLVHSRGMRKPVPRATGDFGSRYGKSPIGRLFANGFAVGVAVDPAKTAKTSSKTPFTFPDCLS